MPAIPGLDPSANPAAVVRELTDRRTENTETFLRADGSYQTTVSQSPLHYRDASGAWQRPDNTLVADPSPGYALANRTNAYRAELPSDLASAPVKVSAGGASVAFQLVGGKGKPTAAHSPGAAGLPGPGVPPATANQTGYPSALAGVDVSYAAEKWGLKETLTLARPGVPSRYDFSVATTGRVTPVVGPDGAVELRQAGGAAPLTFAPPTVVDAKGVPGPVTPEVKPQGSGFSYALRVDGAWLADPARAWPVVLDPSVTLNGFNLQNECLLNNIGADSRLCGDTSYTIANIGRPYYWNNRMLMQYGLAGVIPVDANVLQAQLSLYVDQATPAMELHRVTRDWATTNNSTPTWNTASPSTPWTTPGGDFDGSTSSYQIAGYLSTPTTGPGFTSFFPTQLVQDWVSRLGGGAAGQADQGLLIKLPDTTFGYYTVESSWSTTPNEYARMVVQWYPRMGDEPTPALTTTASATA
ncbi:MAG: DNRLRE domain-containing protein [Actinobacteria bacterium]|nr:DNRLRE domain-containing protein [Actinomycetota bacterium]